MVSIYGFNKFNYPLKMECYALYRIKIRLSEGCFRKELSFDKCNKYVSAMCVAIKI